MIAYHIKGTTADRAEMNITQSRADELAAQGWLISADPIVWAEKQYVGGDLQDIPQPEPPSPYVPTLEEVKSQRKSYINSRRNQAEAATPFEYDGSLLDYDSLSRERINSAVVGSTIAAIGGTPTSTVVATWRLYDNTERNMTIADWLAFKQAEITRSGACHSKATQLKESIDNATTIEEVNAIEW